MDEKNTYHVAENGKAESDGSQGSPWPSVRVALEKVGGGKTIVLAPGAYPGALTIPASCAGTPDSPTVLRSARKWQAVCLGSPAYGVNCEADWVVLDGLQILGARHEGFRGQGSHCTIRNCCADMVSE